MSPNASLSASSKKGLRSGARARGTEQPPAQRARRRRGPKKSLAPPTIIGIDEQLGFHRGRPKLFTTERDEVGGGELLSGLCARPPRGS